MKEIIIEIYNFFMANKIAFNAFLALIVLFVFLFIGKTIKEKRKIKKKYKESLEAILFLLKTEDNHCQNNEENFNKSLRNTMRKYTKIETELSWSGKFSRANCEAELNKFKNQEESNFIMNLLKKLMLGIAKS